jgi:hypothetical protein
LTKEKFEGFVGWSTVWIPRKKIKTLHLKFKGIDPNSELGVPLLSYIVNDEKGDALIKKKEQREYSRYMPSPIELNDDILSLLFPADDYLQNEAWLPFSLTCKQATDFFNRKVYYRLKFDYEFCRSDWNKATYTSMGNARLMVRDNNQKQIYLRSDNESFIDELGPVSLRLRAHLSWPKFHHKLIAVSDTSFPLTLSIGIISKITDRYHSEKPWPSKEEEKIFVVSREQLPQDPSKVSFLFTATDHPEKISLSKISHE